MTGGVTSVRQAGYDRRVQLVRPTSLGEETTASGSPATCGR